MGLDCVKLRGEWEDRRKRNFSWSHSLLGLAAVKYPQQGRGGFNGKESI